MTGPARPLLDLRIDGADRAALRRWNAVYRLRIGRWHRTEQLRELVRAGMRKRLASASISPGAMRRLLELW